MTSWQDSSGWQNKRPSTPSTGPLSTRTQLRLGRMETFTEQLTSGLPGCDGVHLAMEKTVEAKGRLLVELLRRQEHRIAIGEISA